MFTERQIEVFNQKVIRAEGDQCWDWSASKDPLGYGFMTLWDTEKKRGKTMRAHRMSFYLHYGYMPDGDVIHLCHNPTCSNPLHLTAGTRSENMMTSYYSGRLQRKLPLQDLPAIVARCKTPADMKEVAAEYGCTYTAVRHMVRRHKQVG
ncbi:HNH endonuclease [Sinorhizobium meliloti]|nr:HNH endonuclease [Sinorhizobium meliloti]